jgi:hypothetical protein
MGRLVAPAVLALTTVACWPVPGANPDNTNHNPFETAITAANVDQLEHKWDREDTSSGALSLPVLSAGGVHVVDDCQLVTLAPRTGAVRWTGSADPFGESTCLGTKPTWVQISPGQPFVSGGTVSAGVDLGFYNPPYNFHNATTSTFDVTTGARVGPGTDGVLVARRGSRTVTYTQPSAPQSPSDQILLKRLTVTDGGAGRDIDVGVTQGGGIALAPPSTAGADELVVAGFGPRTSTPGDTDLTSGLFGYSYTDDANGCGQFTHQVYLPSHGSPFTTVNTVDCPTWINPLDGSWPVTAPVLGPGGVAYTVTMNGTLFAVDGADTLWSAPLAGGSGAPFAAEVVLAGGIVYAPTAGGVAAYPAAGCGAPTCSPAWTADTGTDQGVTATVVAGDVLYAAANDSVFAFPAAGCGAATCTPLTTLSTPNEGNLVVANGQLYASGYDRISAFGLP